MIIELSGATFADATDIFVWRNDPQNRRFSINPKEISWDDHRQWFAGVLADRSRHLLIAREKGVRVGVLRFDLEDKVAEISIYVAPGLTGRGYGTAILKAGIEWAQANLNVVCLAAKVLVENEASVRLFKKAKFSVTKKTDGFLLFNKEMRR